MSQASKDVTQSRLSGVKQVRVGTLNAPKLEAVRAAFAAFAPNARVDGVAVDSGVSEQPVGYEEIIRGATNRASRAAAASECDFGVGIEDGLIPVPFGTDGSASGSAGHLNVGCAAVTDGRRTAIGFSAAFAYPPDCLEPALLERKPIGDVFDQHWALRAAAGSPAATLPSARTTGNIGKLTDGVLPRSEYARHGVVCALVAFLRPDWYGLDSSD